MTSQDIKEVIQCGIGAVAACFILWVIYKGLTEK